jgi:DnaJ-class molecular chaperone
MEENPLVCSVCGKPLEWQVCSKCAGAGKVKAGLFGKRTCPQCGGRGGFLRCHGWLGHLAQGLPGAGQVQRKLASRESSVHPLCPRCQGTKVIFVGGTMELPCPECNGKGWV